MSVQPGMVRVSFELDQDVARRMHLVIQWGTKGPCLRVLATKLVEAVEKHGQVMVGAILDGNFHFIPDIPPAPQEHKRKKGNASQ